MAVVNYNQCVNYWFQLPPRSCLLDQPRWHRARRLRVLAPAGAWTIWAATTSRAVERGWVILQDLKGKPLERKAALTDDGRRLARRGR